MGQVLAMSKRVLCEKLLPVIIISVSYDVYVHGQGYDLYSTIIILIPIILILIITTITRQL